MSKSNFSEELDQIRKTKEFHSLRELNLKLKKLNSTISLTKLSKILRGIQNPSNQQEFKDLMHIFEITDPVVISRLEVLANDFVPVKTPTDEELAHNLPIFTGKTFNSQKELEEWSETFKAIIKKDYEPEP